MASCTPFFTPVLRWAAGNPPVFFQPLYVPFWTTQVNANFKPDQPAPDAVSSPTKCDGSVDQATWYKWDFSVAGPLPVASVSMGAVQGQWIDFSNPLHWVVFGELKTFMINSSPNVGDVTDSKITTIAVYMPCFQYYCPDCPECPDCDDCSDCHDSGISTPCCGDDGLSIALLVLMFIERIENQKMVRNLPNYRDEVRVAILGIAGLAYLSGYFNKSLVLNGITGSIAGSVLSGQNETTYALYSRPIVDYDELNPEV